jgi:hypothetical protein
VPGSLVGDQDTGLSPLEAFPVVLVAVFGVALLIAVLVSGLAARSVLSTSLLFLAAGALATSRLVGAVLASVAPEPQRDTAAPASPSPPRSASKTRWPSQTTAGKALSSPGPNQSATGQANPRKTTKETDCARP